MIGNRKIISILFVFSTLFLATMAFMGYKNTDNSENSIVIGVTSGPHQEIMEFIKENEDLKPESEQVKIILKIFDNFDVPNRVLNDGDLDLNIFQHAPFLDEHILNRGYKIENYAKTILLPMGIYSNRIKSLSDLKKGSIVSIPNDPTNNSRALLLLQNHGLITLKTGSDLSTSIYEITDNPYQMEFMEVDPPSLPRTIDDVDISVINTDWVIVSGILEVKDAITVESSDSPYVNIIAIRSDILNDSKFEEKKDLVQKFLKIYQSDKTKSFIADKYNGAITTAW